MQILSIGSRTTKEQEGIQFFAFDEKMGTLHYRTGIKGIENPTFQCYDEQTRMLYSVSETDEDGSLFGYHLDADYSSHLLFTQPSKGFSPCHAAYNPVDEYLSVSNYGNGMLTVLSGSRMENVVHHEAFFGTGKNPVRQTCSHIHSSLWSHDNSTLYVADLGLDTIWQYRNHLQTKIRIATPLSSGPRHMVLSKDEKFLYVSAELSNEVLVYHLASEAVLIQRCPTIPTGFTAENTVSDIHFSPDYRNLYCANRGHDSIAIFQIDDSTGLLFPVGHVPTHHIPWNFTISFYGTFVFVANTGGNCVTVHKRETKDGTISNPVFTLPFNNPTCLTLIDK